MEVWPSSQRITAIVVAEVQRVAIRSTKPTITPIPMGHMAPQLPTTGLANHDHAGVVGGLRGLGDIGGHGVRGGGSLPRLLRGLHILTAGPGTREPCCTAPG